VLSRTRTSYMTVETPTLNASDIARRVAKTFARESGVTDVEYEVRDHAGRTAIVFQLANPSERLYRILENSLDVEGAGDQVIATLKRRTPRKPLQTPEAKFLLRTLSESLTATRFSFGEDFFNRYINSV